MPSRQPAGRRRYVFQAALLPEGVALFIAEHEGMDLALPAASGTD